MRKRKWFPATFSLLLMLPVLVSGSQAAFYRNLKLGDSGNDVFLLQQLLNKDKDSQISQAGPGSPGQETYLFGPKTKGAVIRFQEKYSNDILIPNGLNFGTGIVGVSTRKKLEALFSSEITKNNPPPQPAPPSKPTTSTPVTSVNPNSQNLEIFLGEIKTVQIQNGKSSSEADALTQALRQIALSTTTDFRAKFFKDAAKFSSQPKTLSYSFPPLGGFLQSFFLKAYAAVGAPFGGPLLYAFPCTCSATTLVTIGPPVGGVFDYVYGTQAFLSFNAPYAAWFLGIETPGAGSTCSIYVGFSCTVVPSQGLITPMVGTSPE